MEYHYETDENIEALMKLRSHMEQQSIIIKQTNELIDNLLSGDVSLSPFVISIVNRYKMIYDPRIGKEEEDLLNGFLVDVDKELKATCVHDYCEDSIDTGIETSKNITYCSRCMCTFPTG
jgi:hypothetical protein